MEYTKIGFYDNEAQTWSNWYGVEIGHEGNFVYDKTTDNAKVTFYSDTKPSIKINEWAFLGHFTDDISTTLTYDSDGLPTNHEQYIVAKFEMQSQKNGDWLINLALIEPIETMRGVVTETLSFTNQTQKTITSGGVDTTYIKEPYNCLTALERVLRVTPANNNITKSWYARITILDSTFLEAIAFDDDTFTAGDLFTILFKIDDIVDRTPVLYFDMANLGAIKKYILKFERKDGFDKTELNYETLITDNIGLTENDSIDTFATGVISEVDNLTTNGEIKFPSVNMWAVPEIDTEDREVPTGNTHKGEWYIKLPYKIKTIKHIKKLYIYGYIEETNTGIIYVPKIQRILTDINSKYILEKQNYLASELLVTNKYDLFWFEQGTNKLYINEYYSKTISTTTDYNTIIYYIEFEPVIDTALQYGDNNYQIQINQTDSQIESLKYTKFLYNYLKGMNKPDILFTKIYTSFDDFKDLLGSIVLKDNEEYIISNISYKNANQIYIVAFQLNNANLRRNANVKANEQIKANKTIEYNNLKDRRSRFVDFIKIDTTSNVEQGEYLTNKLLILSALIPTQISSGLCPQVVLFRAKSVLQKQDMTFEWYQNEFLMNFVKIINKGQIQFAIKTLDNAQIGTQKQQGDTQIQASPTSHYKGFQDVLYQTPIVYTDPFGEVQDCDYIFSNIDTEEFDNIDLSYLDEAKLEYDRTMKMYQLMSNLPLILEDYRQSIIDNAIIEITLINKYKDMLEIENDSFIFNVTSDNKNIIVCQSLLELSRLIQPTDTHDIRVMAYTQKMAETDVFGSTFISTTAEAYDSEKITLTFNTSSLPITEIKSFVIFSLRNTIIKPMLIINNPNETDIRNGFINIYY